MIPLQVFQASSLNSPTTMPPLSDFGWRFLAEGDSWFTVGALNPLRNANLLFALAFERSAVAINCALPGDTLTHMADVSRDPMFAALLAGRIQRPWDGLLLSCGGNDLIDALQVPPLGHPSALRLLLRPEEWGDASLGAVRYLSEAGWQTFVDYLRANLASIVALRDAGQSRGVPIFLHGYALPTPRPAPAGPGLGPWLLPPLQAYGIPAADHGALAALLMRRLGDTLAGCAADPARYPNLHFFDSAAVALEPAAAGSGGTSGDWVNEIHLTREGCRKLAGPWARAIEAVMAG